MEQLKAIQETIERIEDRLTDTIDIAELAKAAGMSFWHFQRTFAAMVGEPVGRYIRRRRLAHSARRLFDYRGTILDLALEYQFESHEAFTRAFKAELSVTPSDWRDGRGAITFPRSKEFLTQETLDNRYLNMELTPEIVTLGPQTFVGLQARFISAASPAANNLQVIPKLWERFFGEATRLRPVEPHVFYGVCECVESRGLKRLHPDEALYLAAARVEPDSKTPEGMERWQTPGGDYAKFIHRGRVEKIGETMGYIYAKWFPNSGYDQVSGPDFERYDARFDPQSDESELEIFIPVGRGS